MLRDDRRGERSFKATYANGGPGFSGFDRRLERDGVWYDLSVEARRLYACGYMVLERWRYVEATQRELVRATGLAPKCIVRARRELAERGLVRIHSGMTRTGGDVIELVEYAPSIGAHRERKEKGEAEDRVVMELSRTPAIAEIQRRALAHARARAESGGSA